MHEASRSVSSPCRMGSYSIAGDHPDVCLVIPHRNMPEFIYLSGWRDTLCYEVDVLLKTTVKVILLGC